FLSRPNQPPALALPRLRAVRPDRRPVLLITRPQPSGGLAEVRAKLATMGIAAHSPERHPADPLVAAWLMAPDEYSSAAAWCADLLLLGGGWPLLDAILDRLEHVEDASRRDCLARLRHLRGVWLTSDPDGRPAPPPTAADFAPGGAPFDR
ncbi:MAG TPA: hypothetical protein VFN71_15990, partial [Methylomirabilota bacterium]|nr:hypothetical protein [Methylomirabilota bacterium]